MKIIDSFCFSEPMEANMLLVKLSNEYNYISEFLLIENSYDFKGVYKGIFALDVLNNDSRFDAFRDKITVFSASKQMHGNRQSEKYNFDRENWQRSLVYDYLVNKYSNDDYVIISDTDESIDFSSADRKTKVLNILDQNKSKNIISIGRMRYWFDYDNRCYHNDLHIPVVPILRLKTSGKSALLARHCGGIKYNAGESPLAFEYSYCFPSVEEQWRKKLTFSHTGFSKEDIEIALKCNTWIRSKCRGETFEGKDFELFEQTSLTEQNSPKYVRDNLEWLKTNIVDVNYKNNRIIYYPHIFG